MKREMYEDLYRAAWEAQNIVDRESNKRLKADPLFRDPNKAKESGKAGGLIGGRPKKKKSNV